MTRADLHQAWLRYTEDDELTTTGRMRDRSVEDGRSVFDLSPELYLVDAARRRPSLLASGLDDAGEIDGVVPTPRGYGLADADGLRGIVVELVGPPGHSHRLLSTQAFVMALAGWLWTVVTTESLGAKLPTATVCILHAPSGGPAVAQSVGLSVHSDGSTWVATTVGEWAARCADDVEPHLAAALAGRR